MFNDAAREADIKDKTLKLNIEYTVYRENISLSNVHSVRYTTLNNSKEIALCSVVYTVSSYTWDISSTQVSADRCIFSFTAVVMRCWSAGDLDLFLFFTRTLREKTTLAVTSGGRFGTEDEKAPAGTSSRRRSVPRNLAAITVGGSESIMVQALRLEELQRAKEEKR